MSTQIVKGTVVAVVLTAVLNSIVYWIGQRAGASFMLAEPVGPANVSMVAGGMVLVVSVVTAVVAGVGLWLLHMVTEQALVIFQWALAIVALFSFIPLYQSVSETSSFAALGLMHVISPLIILYSLGNHFQEERMVVS